MSTIFTKKKLFSPYFEIIFVHDIELVDQILKEALYLQNYAKIINNFNCSSYFMRQRTSMIFIHTD